jgi:short subunit dehydrogenase-like uncharacterized protein
MIGECAVSMVQDTETLPKSFGVVTPVVAFGTKLQERLTNKGIMFDFRS